MTSTDYDSIVIGAGHNGLVCANYLARAGQHVLLVEASPTIGGLAAHREFHPGFRVSLPHTVTHFSRKVAQDLELAKHGFRVTRTAPPITGFRNAGTPISLSGGSLTGASPEDRDAFADYSRLMRRFAGRLAPFWRKTIPRIGGNSVGELGTFAHLGLNLRRLGRRDMGEFLRMAALPTRDLMDESFEDDPLKVILSWDGLIGGKLAPRSPNNSVITMLYRMSGEPGGPGLIPALRASAEAAGVEIRTESPVARIQVDPAADSRGQHASAIRLQNGETLTARSIVSSADPTTTFLDLVGVDHLEIGFTNRIRRLRSKGFVGKLHLALRELPRFNGLERPAGRLILAPTLDSIEFAYDDAKYGEGSDSPVLEAVIPSLDDSGLAPDGQHVLSAHVMYVPHSPRNGDNDSLRQTMMERSLEVLEAYAPGIRETIIAQEFLTPMDIERSYGVHGGHWHHVEVAADQLLMMRPTYEAAQYRTPIPGLFLCGAGCHPGGDLTGHPGRNAAREILR